MFEFFGFFEASSFASVEGSFGSEPAAVFVESVKLSFGSSSEFEVSPSAGLENWMFVQCSYATHFCLKFFDFVSFDFF